MPTAATTARRFHPTRVRPPILRIAAKRIHLLSGGVEFSSGRAVFAVRGTRLPGAYNAGMRSGAAVVGSDAEVVAITLNGEPCSLASPASIGDLIQRLGLDEDAVAVERNREIVARSVWPETVLLSGDTIEVVQFVGGG